MTTRTGLDNFTFQKFTEFVLNPENSSSPLWEHVTFYVSDMPQLFKHPLKYRLEKLSEASKSFAGKVIPTIFLTIENIQMVHREICKGHAHLDSIIRHVRSLQSVSGLLLQNPNESTFSETGLFKMDVS